MLFNCNQINHKRAHKLISKLQKKHKLYGFISAKKATMLFFSFVLQKEHLFHKHGAMITTEMIIRDSDCFLSSV